MDEDKNTLAKENEVVNAPKTHEEVGDKAHGEENETVSGASSEVHGEDEKKKDELESKDSVEDTHISSDTHVESTAPKEEVESSGVTHPSVTESKEDVDHNEVHETAPSVTVPNEVHETSPSENHESKDTHEETPIADGHVSSEVDDPKKDETHGDEGSVAHQGTDISVTPSNGEVTNNQQGTGPVVSENIGSANQTPSPSVTEDKGSNTQTTPNEVHEGENLPHVDASKEHEGENPSLSTPSSDKTSEENKSPEVGGDTHKDQPSSGVKEDGEYNTSSGFDNEDDDLDYQNYLDLVDLNKSIGEYIRRYQARAKAKVPLFDITYTLDRSPNAHCNIPNELILDNTGYYYKYDSETTKINGKEAKVVLNAPGSLITLNALDSDKTLSFSLSRPISNTPINLNPEAIDGCLNTQYGFKLSEVIANLGKIIKIPLDTFGEKTKGARLTITQRAFLVKSKRQIIFNFYFSNKGFEHARRVLFKDILPKGVSLNLNGVYINSCLCCPEHVNIDGQKLLVKMPIIEKMSTATLTLICSLCDDHPSGQVNIGVVSYVSKYVLKILQKDPLHLIQSMSNAKSIDEIVRGCSTPIENFKC